MEYNCKVISHCIARSWVWCSMYKLAAATRQCGEPSGKWGSERGAQPSMPLGRTAPASDQCLTSGSIPVPFIKCFNLFSVNILFMNIIMWLSSMCIYFVYFCRSFSLSTHIEKRPNYLYAHILVRRQELIILWSKINDMKRLYFTK